MKFLILLACVVIAHCAPAPKGPGYKFSYATGDSAQSEIGEADGSVRGAYTYIDDTGAVHNVKYQAGSQDGFKILENNVDLSSANTSKEFPLAHEIKLVDGLTPEVAAARQAHLLAYDSIRSLLPDIEEEEEVRVHHLRHEVPATVHRTTVPESIHNQSPPPVLRRAPLSSHVPTVEKLPFIDGLTSEQAADVEANYAYQNAIKKLLPELKHEGEIIIPVHHVHHVHHQGHVQAAPPRVTTHQVKITTKPNVHIIEHLAPVPVPFKVVEIPRDFSKEQSAFPLGSEIELIEGYTPEVWANRQAHLAQVAAIKAVLPNVEEQGF